jgi:hypothetical protein
MSAKARPKLQPKKLRECMKPVCAVIIILREIASPFVLQKLDSENENENEVILYIGHQDYLVKGKKQIF